MFSFVVALAAAVWVCLAGYLSPKFTSDDNGAIFVMLLFATLGPITVDWVRRYKDYSYTIGISTVTMRVSAIMGAAVSLHFFNQIAHGDWIFNPVSKIFGFVYFGAKLVLILFVMFFGLLENNKQKDMNTSRPTS